MREPLYQIVEPPRPCSYVPDETASLEYRLFDALSPAELEEWVFRGWRRFGVHLFRPVCQKCARCVPVRVLADRFQPSKSQRRVQRQNKHVRVEFGPASLTEEHVQLYNVWHADMAKRREWPEQVTTLDGYFESFLVGRFPSACELRYYDGTQLIGIGLIDVMPDSLSSIYFYHHPDWRDASPGTFSLMQEIETARQLQLSHVYLGYWIEACQSMAYKNRFHPFQMLQSIPDFPIAPTWMEETGSSASTA